MKITPKMIALLALFTTLALTLSIVDNYITIIIPIPLPGFKLGIANIVMLYLVLNFKPAPTFLVVFLRCFIASMYGGGITVFLISLSGGLLSIAGMYSIKRLFPSSVSEIGISVFGAAFHSFGQVLMVIFLLSSPNYIFYLPILLVVSTVTGFIIGAIGSRIYPVINKAIK